MTRVMIVLASVVVLPLPMMAGEDRPKGPPPLMMVASVDGAGHALIKRVVMEFVPVIENVSAKVGDRQEERQVTCLVPVQKEVEVTLEGKDVEVFGIDGKRIDPADLPNLPQTSYAGPCFR